MIDVSKLQNTVNWNIVNDSLQNAFEIAVKYIASIMILMGKFTSQNAHLIQWSWFVSSGVVCLSIYIWKKNLNRRRNSYPLLSKGIINYQAAPVMNASEKVIYWELVNLLGANYFIFPQCGMGGLISLHSTRSLSKKDESHYRKPFEKKRTDFVIVDKKTSLPLLIVEFNGLGKNGHNQGNYIFRDIEKSFSAKKAGIPLLVLPGHIITSGTSRKLIVNKAYIKGKLNDYPIFTLPHQ